MCLVLAVRPQNQDPHRRMTPQSYFRRRLASQTPSLLHQSLSIGQKFQGKRQLTYHFEVVIIVQQYIHGFQISMHYFQLLQMLKNLH